jgi:tetratricopeptide (TPR) repeat protein
MSKAISIPLLLTISVLWPFAPAPAHQRENKPAATASSETKAGKDYSHEPIVYERIRGELRFENDGTGTTLRRVRLRVQDYAGVQKAGQLVFNYNAANEELEVRTVRVTKPDGHAVMTNEEAIQDLSSPVAQAAPMYTDLRQKHVIVAGLSPGDILEYETITTTTMPLFAGQFWPSWDFIADAISLDEQVELNIPGKREVKVNSPGAIRPEVREEAGRRIYHWSTSNLTHPKAAEIPTRFDPLRLLEGARTPQPRRLLVSTFANWLEIAEWYAQLERNRRIPTAEVRAKADEIAHGAKTDLEKVHAIYDYVARNVRYVSLSFGVGRYQPHTAAEVLANQYGDCKDKATLLEAMLDALGFSASPVLLHTHLEIDPGIPSPLQFDHVINFLKVGEQQIWLDSTGAVTPFRYLLPQVRGKNALVVNSSHYASLTRIPAGLPEPTLYRLELEGSADEANKFDARLIFETRGDLEVLIRAGLVQVPLSQLSEAMAAGAKQSSKASDFSISDVDATDPYDTSKPMRMQMRFRATFPEDKKKQDTKSEKGPGLKAEQIAELLSYILPDASDSPGSKEPVVHLGGPTDLDFKIRFTISAKDKQPVTPKKQDPFRVSKDFAEYQSHWSNDGRITDGEWQLSLRVNEIPSTRGSEYVDFRKQVLKNLSELNAPTVVASTATSSPQERYNAALRAFNSGKCHEAAKGYEELLVTDPEFKGAWNDLGRAYLCLGRREKAVEALRKAVEVDPRDPFAYNNLGRALWGERKYDDAIEFFRKQIEINSQDRYAHANLGRLFLETEKYEQALKELETAALITPDDAALQASLGRVYARMEQPEKAVAAFERAVSLDQSWVTLNNAAYYMTESDLNLERASAYANLAMAQKEKELNQMKLAGLQERSAILMTQAAMTWDTVGWIKFKQHDLSGAQKYLQAASDLSNSPTIWMHLGRVYEAQNRKTEAIEVYAKSLGSSPTTSEDAPSGKALSMTVPEQTSRAFSADEKEAHARLAALLGSDAEVPLRVAEALKSRDNGHSVEVPNKQSKQGNAVLLLVLSVGGEVKAVRQFGGKADLGSMLSGLRLEKLEPTFPDANVQQMVRSARLVCSDVVNGCLLTLLSSETAFRVVSEAAAQSATQP